MSGLDNVICPGCESLDSVNLGKIPSSAIFAGRYLDSPLPGGNLWKCRNCHLQFRHPRLVKNTLDKLYKDGLEENWMVQASHRSDWNIAAKYIKADAKITRVMDVGCFNGQFLNSLNGNYEKIGIEIHSGAAQAAASLGIKIISHDFEKLNSGEQVADVAVAFDVIEHTENPMKFLEGLSGAITSGGLIIISTGNTQAISWKIMGSAYWYCHIAEHISFVNPRWVTLAAKKLNLRVVNIEKFSHDYPRTRFGYGIYELITNIVFRLSPTCFMALRKFGFGGIDTSNHPEMLETPPYWLSAKDHFIFVLKKE